MFGQPNSFNLKTTLQRILHPLSLKTKCIADGGSSCTVRDWTDSFSEYVERRSDYLKSRFVMKTIWECNRALEKNPQDHEVLANRALLRFYKQDLIGACNDLDLALKIKPDDAVSLVLRGLAREQRGDEKGSEEDLAECNRLDPAIGVLILAGFATPYQTSLMRAVGIVPGKQ
jgi:tetratricopeptide (TPR) repeat protein